MGLRLTNFLFEKGIKRDAHGKVVRKIIRGGGLQYMKKNKSVVNLKKLFEKGINRDAHEKVVSKYFK